MRVIDFRFNNMFSISKIPSIPSTTARESTQDLDPILGPIPKYDQENVSMEQKENGVDLGKRRLKKRINK